MKRLYFIRHGESEMNVAGLFAGSATETPLTENGRVQAAKAGEKAKELGIDLIVSSPQSRAKETAEIIAGRIGYPVKKIVYNELFVERFYGKLEGQPYKANMAPEDMKNAETRASILKRARKALDYLESRSEEIILVVSHGSFGRALRHHILDDFPYSRYHRIPNAELIELL